jgi:hypothetical protein
VQRAGGGGDPAVAGCGTVAVLAPVGRPRYAQTAPMLSASPISASVQRSSGGAALRRPWQVADGLLRAGGFQLDAERDRVGHQRQQVGASGRGLRFGR